MNVHQWHMIRETPPAGGGGDEGRDRDREEEPTGGIK